MVFEIEIEFCERLELCRVERGGSSLPLITSHRAIKLSKRWDEGSWEKGRCEEWAREEGMGKGETAGGDRKKRVGIRSDEMWKMEM